jgi:CPA2 family monovalent cation:H+ antiporter-2
MDLWTTLLDILVLLTAAMVLGGLCTRFRQSPLLGYLLAGILLGPNALDLVPSHAAVTAIAELGVALLLFTIGLEFSWRRLRAVGPIALGGGTLQVLLTGTLTTVVCVALGLGLRASLAVGAMIAISSTAAVARLLASRAEIEAIHGRNAIGILLLQDIAVVPLVIMVVALGSEASLVAFGWAVIRALGVAALLVGALHVLLNKVVPLLLNARGSANRDLPILLAVVTGLGAAWASHALGFSPVLGAFVAGMLLAESPFATQIRANVTPLQTLFVTLFFTSIGMLSNPAWVLGNWVGLVAAVVTIVVGKAAITTGVTRLFGFPLGQSLATGVVLAQVGEFSLVIAGVALSIKLIDAGVFEMIIAALTITLFLTPYLTALAPRLATGVGRLSMSSGPGVQPMGEGSIPGGVVSNHLVIVGFGPAGQRVAEALMEERSLPILVVDLNPSTVELAQSFGLKAYIGDAIREDVLEGLHVRTAAAVAVTVPDPGTARQVVELVRSLSPHTAIVVRARYHVHRWQLDVAGASAVVDEENEVGLGLASEVRKRLEAFGRTNRLGNNAGRV